MNNLVKKMKKLYVLCAAIGMMGAANAQQWESTYGPIQNTPLSMVEYNNVLFLGTDWYSYRSTDAGETWERLNVPSASPTFWVIGNKLYSGNNYSTDMGNTWITM